MLRFTDSLTGAKAEFVPRDEGKASVYWCGPTVYDAPHLGHARSALAFDVLVRYLRWRGYEVTAVRNVTDIDDKIIERSNARGVSDTELSAEFEQVYLDEMDRLNIVRPDHDPHATAYVAEMIEVIEQLLERDMAYETSSGVYFAVDRLAEYGALVHRTADELREGAGARVDVDEDKRDPLDFALWKAAKPGEPTWESPWGLGRPGWHIECVAMSLQILGPGFDIHGGGDDLIFPHHENERAECLGVGDEFARYWVHNGMVQVDGEKMSKSLGNFTTMSGVFERYTPRALRLLVLQTHYRRTMEIGADALDAATAAVDRIDAFMRRLASTTFPAGIDPDPAVLDRFREAMDDDLNTAAALGVVFDAIRDANAAFDGGGGDGPALANAVVELVGVLGLEEVAAGPAADAGEIDALVAARQTAREAKDFAEADRIRDDLAARGVTVEDTPNGPIWYR